MLLIDLVDIISKLLILLNTMPSEVKDLDAALYKNLCF
jgi:hypothetical protein